MESLKTIIVDDEELARFELRYLLESFPSVEIAGEADTLSHASTLIQENQPDLIFLDIQLGNESGFDLFNRVDVNAQVIFVSAYDEYALRAFEVNAIDYLLKPVNPKRLKQAIGKIATAPVFRKKSFQPLAYEDRIFINTSRRLRFIEIKSIVCICAEGDYTRVIDVRGEKFLVLRSMKAWEEMLPCNYFNRIHRSTLINNDYIEKIEPWFHSSYQVTLKHLDTPVQMSRRYAAKLKNTLQGNVKSQMTNDAKSQMINDKYKRQ